MKVAIISDIHGNIEAFKAVNAHLVEKKVARVVCLGDMVGYGPNPEEVVQLVQTLRFEAVVGNHELSLIKKKERNRLNFMAKENNIATENLLSPKSHDFIRKLPLYYQLRGAYFVHGFPPDSVHSYAHRQSEEVIMNLFSSPTFNYYFVGHTHELGMISYEDGKLIRTSLREGVYVLQPDGKYLINVGSVGQPRDGDKRAKYVVWDMEKSSIQVNYVTYDAGQTIRKIKERGFPESYGLRLK